MAYINVAEWTPDQVNDWLKGLDDTMYNYVYSFTNNEVGGQQLLNIRPYELEQLGMHSIGHQEIVLEAVENLRNFHYNLDKENLQFMALHVATAARSLHRQLASNCDTSKIETQILNDITRTIATIKPIISWLDRAPFQGQLQFNEIRRNMLRLGLEMATSAQRDRFVQNPVEQIKTTAKKLEGLANYIIQDITDPMLLQPASLNLVTLKKRESELGFNIVSSYHGIHRVTDIKYNSPAHNSGKIEDGDEIVQINYQTVVGWQYKTVIMQLRESLPDVLLTLKKRPKHMKIYGQIYMQPYRLPSKKRVMGARWGENLPSPRAGFLTVPDFNLTMKISEKSAAEAAAAAASTPGGGASSDTDSSCSDILTPTDNKSVDKEIRLYYPKPRAMLQRRNTICGDELFAHQKNLSGGPLWHERKVGANGDPSSPSLRDKSISFGFGLEITTRPTTCIGIASGTGKFNNNNNNNNNNSNDLKGSFSELKSKDTVELRKQENEIYTPTNVNNEQNPNQQQEKSKPGVSKVVRFDANMKCDNYPRNLDEKYTCNVEDTILETFEPIPFADDEEEETLEALRNTTDKASDILQVLDKVSRAKNQQPPLVEAINVHAAKAMRRGRLDKSHSTPAYDNSEGESDTPPAIEPRKEFLLVTPPVPPPRPKKPSELVPPEVPPPPPKPANLRVGAVAINSNETLFRQHAAVTVEEIVAQPQVAAIDSSSLVSKIPKQSNVVAATAVVVPVEENELHTPTKTRTLTLKKKNSLISKRRKMNLKLLGTGDIQGHLYRRTKDRRGVTFWARLYFVLLDTNLYGFRTKEALKASCLIFLPGFTVSLAKEVYSKPFAFKVYHASKTFYFATESQEALNQWIDFIRQATLQIHPGSMDSCDEINVKQLYSETDSSGEETDTTISKNLCTPSPQGSKDGAASSSSLSSSFLSNSKSANTSSTSSSSATGTKQSSDKRYLGSLRNKLTKNSFISKNSSSQNERKPSSDIPVPTEQYRSYRKVPGGSFGIQIGTNTPGYHDVTMHPFAAGNHSNSGGVVNSSSSFFNEQNMLPQRKLSISSSRSSIQSYTDTNATSNLGPPTTPAPTPSTPVLPTTPSSPSPLALTPQSVMVAVHNRDKPSSSSFSSSSSFDSPCSNKSIKKTFPCNFIHASNPNLVEFDFQTSKTLDYSLPKINQANSWEAHQNTQGFVTLKDLMLQKQEEEAQEMYNNRVLLGVEKKEQRNIHKRNDEKSQGCDAANQHHQQQQNEKWTHKRSLPKTPDYEISFKPDDEDIKRTRTKEGLKLRDFGYELISGDEPVSKIGQNEQQLSDHSTWTAAMKTRQLLKSQHHLLSSHKGNKKHSSNSCSSSTNSSIADVSITEKRAGGSFKKKSSKFEAVKTSSERLFQFSKHTSGGGSGVPHHSAMTMTLPLNKKSTGESLSSTGGGSGGIKKSHTYNSELKDKASAKYEAQRKNSAPMPILAKLSFSSASNTVAACNNNNKSVIKEKKLLGSPLLHRTIFGSHHSNHGSAGLSPVTTPPTPFAGREYDQEIFSQIVFTKVPSYHSESAAKFRNLSSSNCNITAPDVEAPPPPIASAATQTLDQQSSVLQHVEREAVKGTATATPAATPEYPNMECPPVFEPEIYSLTDPNANLTFLRRRNNNSSSNGASGAGSADEETQ